MSRMRQETNPKMVLMIATEPRLQSLILSKNPLRFDESSWEYSARETRRASSHEKLWAELEILLLVQRQEWNWNSLVRLRLLGTGREVLMEQSEATLQLRADAIGQVAWVG